MNQTQNGPDPNHHPETGNPKTTNGLVRQLVLFALLAFAVGTWLIDHYRFQPETVAAEEKLETAVEKHNALPISATAGKPFFSSADVQKTLGFAPTKTKLVGENLIEYYCWWGTIPLNRRYITVAYQDSKGERYHRHLRDAEITKDELPLSEKEALELSLKAQRESPNGPDRQMPVPPPAGNPEAEPMSNEPVSPTVKEGEQSNTTEKSESSNPVSPPSDTPAKEPSTVEPANTSDSN